MAYPLPPEDPERTAALRREAAARGVTVGAVLAERVLRRPAERAPGLADMIDRRRSYLEGCRRSEIDDTADNIGRIALELRWLELVAASPELRQLWESDLDACFERLRRQAPGG